MPTLPPASPGYCSNELGAPLRRRSLLLLAVSPPGGAWGTAPSPAQRQHPLLVWHDTAVARWLPGAVPAVMPVVPATAPVVTAAGVWVVTRDARLQRWTFGDDWRRHADVELPVTAHALTASTDGRVALAACGESLRLYDVHGVLLRHYDGTDLQRRRRGRTAALLDLPHRRSLLAAWPALGEWWEISLDPDAEPLFEGLVHDYRMGEAVASPGHLGVRRVPFADGVPLPAFTPPGLPWVAAEEGSGAVVVVHLDVRRQVARLPATQARVAGSALHAGLWWLPVGDGLWGIDPQRWERRETIAAPGAVQALATAGGTLWALADGALYRRASTGWRHEADGVASLASDAGPTPLTSPVPWRGVTALR